MLDVKTENKQIPTKLKSSMFSVYYSYYTEGTIAVEPPLIWAAPVKLLSTVTWLYTRVEYGNFFYQTEQVN